jgi:hypothetical protein
VDAEEEDGDTGELEVPGNGRLGESSSVLRSDLERFDDDDDALYPLSVMRFILLLVVVFYLQIMMIGCDLWLNSWNG